MMGFGPAPSRRLGHNLGVNNIPPEVSTYSCTYCQIGNTEQLSPDGCAFYRSDELASEVW
jgi:wyosine [tRNA(Phe)-imidazoG37] synthetase (radical SAM superfamily)